MKLWRLTKINSVPVAFNGAGASKYGGRWNSVGTKMVYCSTAISLAVLEILVHVDSDLMPAMNVHSFDIEDKFVLKNDFSSIINSKVETAKFGDEWVAAGKSAGILVPSIIVPQEFNVLINPDHPDFVSITPTKVGVFDLDKRLLK